MKSSAKPSSPHILLFWSVPSISKIEAYKAKCSKLNQAISKVKTIEVVTIQDKVLMLYEIGVEAGRFYGFERLKGKLKKILLNVNDIKRIIVL